MLPATYIGPIARLKGETAIIIPGEDEDTLLAQFDNRDRHLYRDEDGALLQYGWHAFSINDFRIIVS